MKKINLITLLTVAMLSACSTSETPTVKTTSNETSSASQGANYYYDLILKAEENSTGKVRDILSETRKMALEEKTIVQGGCWDYLDTAWTRAGVPRQDRQTIFQNTKSGPYADTNQLKAGDWLYYVNYSYNNIEHSGMFIAWADENNKLGIVLSYAGEARQEPARYKIYDLSGVYQITRAK